MLRGVDVAGAEQNGESGHGHGHRQRHAVDGPPGKQKPAGPLHVRHQCLQRHGDGLQLQRDIGHHADDGDKRHQRAQRPVLAIAGGNEVGDGGDVLRSGDPHQPPQQRPSGHQQQRRADVDGQEIQPRARRKPHRAEKRPGRAIDAQRQHIDERARPPAPARKPVAQRGDGEQCAHIGQGDIYDHPGIGHRARGSSLNDTIAGDAKGGSSGASGLHTRRFLDRRSGARGNVLNIVTPAKAGAYAESRSNRTVRKRRGVSDPSMKFRRTSETLHGFPLSWE